MAEGTTMQIHCLPALLLLTVNLSVSAADNWPRYRGPDAMGVAEDAQLPDAWDTSKNVEWKSDIPGRGWSSPIVWGNRVFLTTVVDSGNAEEAKKGLYFGGNRNKASKDIHEWRVLCLDLTTGDVLWNEVVHKAAPENSIHIKNSYASETPVTDGEFVYAYFGNVGVFCFDFDGKLQWKKPFDLVRTRYDWGTASSPILHNGRLYIVNDNEEQSYLVAFDASNGDEIWRVNRDEGSNWAAPFVWENELRTELITPGTGKTRAYDLSGKELYQFGGASSITIATPYAKLFVSSGYILDLKKPIWAIQPGAFGDISLKPDETSNEFVTWCQKGAGPYNPSTIVYGDQLYVLLDRGLVTSYDARTGKPVYGRKRLPNGRAFTSSPVAANGRLYFVNEFGVTFVVKAGSEYELLAENALSEDDMCMATPAIVGDRLLIRTDARIYCVRGAR
jgi:outer membrane protein assembly factor BamB